MNQTLLNLSISRQRRLFAAALALSTLPIAGLVSGCGMTSSGSSAAGSAATTVVGHTTIQGAIHGGNQPIVGASIQMYAVGTSGNGSAAQLLNTATVTTVAGGAFTVTGLYTCPVANPAALTYIVGTGGNPGLTPSTINNTKIVMFAALGACNTLLANFPFISVDEVTTVASAYALAPFMVDATHIGAASTNATGIANAFLTANSLVNISTGTSPSSNLPATSTVPVSEIYTIADILSVCVNSDGTGLPCAGLLSATTAGTVTAVDTATAALSFAKNPTNQVHTLYTMTPGTGAPFNPTLGTQPSDWTVAVKSTGAGLNAPAGIAIDATGNAWIANAGGSSITELGPTGTVLSGASGYTSTGLLGPQGVAIDTSGNVWVANSYGANVIKMTVASGSVTGSTAYTAGGITSPYALAIDTSNNVWVANYDNGTVAGLTSAGAAISGSPFTAGGTLSYPTGIAIDASANVWVSSSGTGTVVELSNAGATLSGAGYTDGAILAPAGVAIDKLGNTYVADLGINAVSVFGTSGSPSASSPVQGSLSGPAGVATDGANVAWITDSQSSGSLTMLATPTGTPVALGSLSTPSGVAVDASGNVWTANAGDNSVTQFIGLATAVKTPLVNRFQ